MTTSAPAAIGLIDLPSLVPLLASSGIAAITGEQYREAATGIRAELDQRREQGNPPFAILLSNTFWPGRKAWSSKAALETTVIVLNESDSNEPIAGAVNLPLPATVRDVFLAAGYHAPEQYADLVINANYEVVQPMVTAAPVQQVAAPVPTAAPVVEQAPPAPVQQAPVIEADDPWDSQVQQQIPPAPAPVQQAPVIESNPWDSQRIQQVPEAVTVAPPAPVVSQPDPLTAPLHEFDDSVPAPVVEHVPVFAPPAHVAVDVVPEAPVEQPVYAEQAPVFAPPAPVVVETVPEVPVQQPYAEVPVEQPVPVAEQAPVFAPPAQAVPLQPTPVVEQPYVETAPVFTPPTPVAEQPYVEAAPVVEQAPAHAFVPPAAQVQASPVVEQPVVESAPVFAPPAQVVQPEQPYAAPPAPPVVEPYAEAPVQQQPVYAPPVVQQEPVEAQAPTHQPYAAAPAESSFVASRYKFTTPAPRQPGLAETVVVYASKGGVGKSTCSFSLAQRCAKAGLRTILIDGNVGQGDMRTFLRISNAGLPSMYQAALADDLNQALIDPETLTASRSPGLDPLGFAVVQAPPPHLVDTALVSPEAYLSIIEQARMIADVVIVDTQIVEAEDKNKQESDMVDRLLIPLLRAGAWGFGVTDLSSPGIGNLLTRLKEFAAAGVPREYQMTSMNRVPQTAGFNPDGVEMAFNEHSVFLGVIYNDDLVIEHMNRGRSVCDMPVIAPILDAALFRVTGRPEFSPSAAVEVAAEENGRSSRRKRKKERV